MLRVIACALALVLGCDSVALAAERTVAPLTPVQIVHQKLAKRGTGKSVKIVRHDGSELKGNIAALTDDSVSIAPKQGSVSTVPLSDIAEVKGTGLSTGAKVGIGVGVGIVVTVGVLALVVNHELNKPWGNP